MNIKVTDFAKLHIKQAKQIAMQNYENERGYCPALPATEIPDLMGFAENNLGVAAFDSDNMLGFLCSVPPFANAFGSTDAVGVFSPVYANGAIEDNRAEIYARMYQAVGQKWVSAGATSHAVCLYAHDAPAQEQFYKYGFGLRCIDAIRGMDDVPCPPCVDYEFSELSQDEYAQVFPLYTLLSEHYLASPFFMTGEPGTPESFIRSCQDDGSRVFIARYRSEICAYLELLDEGETFIAGGPDYRHIGGAYCLPEHRGIGVYPGLLNFVISRLKTENITRLGVDFESINPAAYGFWMKHFTPYTHSVVRRIDEKILERTPVKTKL